MSIVTELVAKLHAVKYKTRPVRTICFLHVDVGSVLRAVYSKI